MFCYDNQYIKIFYNNKLICQGKVISTKKSNGRKYMTLCSIDNKYYFNLDHKDITYTLSKTSIENKVDLIDIPITLWKHSGVQPHMPVYEEVGIDIECQSLINALNSLGRLKTTGSCSGHNKSNLWVHFITDDFCLLKKLTLLFSFGGIFRKDWVISTSKKCLVDSNTNDIILALICKHRGEKAYKCAEKLALYLEQVGGQLSG